MLFNTLSMGAIDKILFYKQDPVFEAAKDLLCQFKAKLDDPEKKVKLNLPLSKRILIYPDEPNVSPGLTCFGENKYFVLIDFPSNSKPYEDNLTDKVKECVILEGNIFDANNPSQKPWGTGDTFLIYPWQKVAPHTKNTTALALVTLQK